MQKFGMQIFSFEISEECLCPEADNGREKGSSESSRRISCPWVLIGFVYMDAEPDKGVLVVNWELLITVALGMEILLGGSDGYPKTDGDDDPHGPKSWFPPHRSSKDAGSPKHSSKAARLALSPKAASALVSDPTIRRNDPQRQPVPV